MGEVTVTAKRLLQEAARNSGRRATVQLPEQFARIVSADQTSTTLSRLFLRGEVVLKLYLTLVMLTRKPPHELFRPYADHYWANLLGYEERTEANPSPGSGTRRIKRAFATLASATDSDPALVSHRVERGRGHVIQVTPPAPAGPLRTPWITLPLELWSNGWINVISARALFVYVCLRLLFVGKTETEGMHVSVWERQRFCLEDDTWQRGISELETLGLVSSAFDEIEADRWSTDSRRRKVYYLNTNFLVTSQSPILPVSRQ